jgi:hypothetical protein
MAEPIECNDITKLKFKVVDFENAGAHHYQMALFGTLKLQGYPGFRQNNELNSDLLLDDTGTGLS